MAAPAHRVARPRPSGLRVMHGRLPWWSLALPAVAFAALLTLTLLHGGDTASYHAAEPLARLLTRIARILPG